MEDRREFLDEDMEIDLKELLIHIIDKSVGILLAGLVLMLILGGYRLANGISAYKAASPQVGEAYGDDDRSAVELYELHRNTYQRQIDRIRALIVSKERYGEESALMQLDADSFYEASLSYYITTGYQLDPELGLQNPDRTAAVVKSYETAMSGGEFYNYIKKSISMDIAGKYLAELISISTDSVNGLLNVNIVGADSRTVSELLSAVESFVSERGKDIGELVEAHDIRLLSSTGVASQNAAESSDGYISQQSVILSKQLELNKSITDYQNQIIDLQKKLEALNKPEDVIFTMSDVIKSAVKLAFIGLILGIFLSAAYYALGFLFNPTLLDEDTAQRSFGLPVLASVRRYTGDSIRARLNSALSGDCERQESREKALSLAAANLISMLEQSEDKGDILFLGTEEADCEEAAAFIGRELEGVECKSAGDIRKSSEAVSRLRSYKRVVLVEKKGISSLRAVQQQCERLRLLKKELCGIVLM